MSGAVSYDNHGHAASSPSDHDNGAIYGIVAEFSDPNSILRAANKAREAGYKHMDAYSPFPIHGMSDAIDFRDNRVPWLVFFGGIAGALTGAGLQFWVNYYEYPMNVGGRPLISWPQFIPITFECTILFAALTAVFVCAFGLNGLPRPHHPIFNARRFELASQDKFFLCIEADDPQFDRAKTTAFLETLGADFVSEVEH